MRCIVIKLIKKQRFHHLFKWEYWTNNKQFTKNICDLKTQWPIQPLLNLILVKSLPHRTPKTLLRVLESTTKQCCKWAHSFPLWLKAAARTLPDAAGTVWWRALRTGLYQGLQWGLWCRGSWYIDLTSCEGWRKGPRRRTYLQAESGQRLQSDSQSCFLWDTQAAPHRSVHRLFGWPQQQLKTQKWLTVF